MDYIHVRPKGRVHIPQRHGIYAIYMPTELLNVVTSEKEYGETVALL